MQGDPADELCTSVQLRYVDMLANVPLHELHLILQVLMHTRRAGNGTQPRRALVSVSDKTGLVELAKVSRAWIMHGSQQN